MTEEEQQKYIDPIGYAQRQRKIKAIEQKNNINHTKELIIEFFSDDLQIDESPCGAMRRNQIRKELLEFAHKKV